MNAEQLVASLEPCMELHKRGVRLDTYFYHNNGEVIDRKFYHTAGCIPAPTAEELASVLPPYLTGSQCCLTIQKSDMDWRVFYLRANIEAKPLMADAMVQMLLWLLDEGHITAEEINGG